MTEVANPTRPVAVFRSPPPGPLAGALACRGAGVQDIASRLSGRRLDHFAAVLVDRGRGYLESDSAGRLAVVAPAIFWLFPGERHGYGPDPGTSWHEHWVLFGGTTASAFEVAGLMDPAHPVMAVECAGEISALFARIRRELRAEGTLAAASASAAVQEIVVQAARLSKRRDDPASASDSCRAAIEAIRAAAFGAIDLAALARRLGMSPATLRRQVRARIGMSPKAFQLRLRIDRAKELLTVGDASIEAIAAGTGFDDPYYFSRLFHAREGLSPSAFRAANRRM